MPQIRHLSSAQWKIFRDIRLKSLRDTPNAFGSTIEKEKIYTGDDWKKRLERSDCKTLVAFSKGSKPIGIIVGAPYDNQAGLFAMWIDPSQRKQGIGSLLVDAVIQWAEEQNFHEIRLDVADDNHPAIALYQSKGFVKSGIVGSLPTPREHIKEHQRVLTIKKR